MDDDAVKSFDSVDPKTLREKCLELACDVHIRSLIDVSYNAERIHKDIITIAKGFEAYILGT